MTDAMAGAGARQPLRLLVGPWDGSGLVVSRAQGAFLWDGAGRRFIDHVLAGGEISVGHCDPRVDETVATTAALVDATGTGPQPGEVELAEAIATLLPGIEKVAFTASVEEAIGLALSAARSAAGGGSALVAGETPVEWTRSGLAGVERTSDWDAAESRLGEGDIAAVVLGRGEGRERLAGAAAAAGCVLVEAGTGLPRQLPSASPTADLTLVGPGLGNGFSIAALGGRADLLDAVEAEGLRRGRPYSLAAGVETLGILTGGGAERMASMGEALRGRLAETVGGAGLPARVEGEGPDWWIDWGGHDGLAAGFRRHMLERGVLIPLTGPCRLAAAHGEEDVEATAAAAGEALERLVS